MDIIRIIRNYIPVTGYHDRVRIANIYNYLKKNPPNVSGDLFNIGGDLIKDHLTDIERVTNEPKEKLWSAGYSLYLSSCFLAMSFGKGSEYYEKLAYYSISYLYVDFALDNDTGKDMILELYQVVINHKTPPVRNRSRAVNAYLQAVCDSERAKKSASQLMLSEIKSVTFQKREDHTYEDYIDMCKEKGRNTTRVLFDILELDCEEIILDNLGLCAQLADDIIDTIMDFKSGIITPSVFDYKERDNIDRTFFLFIKTLDEISNELNVIKFVCLIGVIHWTVKYGLLSPELRRMIEPYIIMDPRCNLDMDTLI